MWGSAQTLYSWRGNSCGDSGVVHKRAGYGYEYEYKFRYSQRRQNREQHCAVAFGATPARLL